MALLWFMIQLAFDTVAVIFLGKATFASYSLVPNVRQAQIYFMLWNKKRIIKVNEPRFV